MATIDRVKYDSASDRELVWKYPKEDLSIGTQLIVNQSQEALLVKGGEALDLFGPGTHTLSTDNLPFLRRLVNLPFGGATPFTAEVWYINKTAKRDIPWGTPQPIQLHDPRERVVLSVRSFGQWGVRVADARRFVSQLVGSRMGASTEQVESYFVAPITQRLSAALSGMMKEGRSFHELVAELEILAARTRDGLTAEFDRFGLELVSFDIMSVTIPPAELQALQKGQFEANRVRASGADYKVMRGLDALEKAAESSGDGGAALSAGLGLGAGVAMAREVTRGMSGETTDAREPPGDAASRLRKLKSLLDEGLITPAEFDAKRKAIVDAL